MGAPECAPQEQVYEGAYAPRGDGMPGGPAEAPGAGAITATEGQLTPAQKAQMTGCVLRASLPGWRGRSSHLRRMCLHRGPGLQCNPCCASLAARRSVRRSAMLCTDAVRSAARRGVVRCGAGARGFDQTLMRLRWPCSRSFVSGQENNQVGDAARRLLADDGSAAGAVEGRSGGRRAGLACHSCGDGLDTLRAGVAAAKGRVITAGQHGDVAAF